MKTSAFRSPYWVSEKIEGISFDRTHPDSEHKTVQHFRDDCNINLLVKRFTETGQYYDPQSPMAMMKKGVRRPDFKDWTKIPDYDQAVHTMTQAKSAFEQLPSGIRDRFQNNPARLIAFVSDPNNKAEAERLGLIPPQKQASTAQTQSGGGNTPPPPAPALKTPETETIEDKKSS